MKRFIVAGNATLDALVQGIVRTEDSKITVIADGVKEEFFVLDGPVTNGLKHRVEKGVEQRIRRLWHRITPGGGGYNSVTALKKYFNHNLLLDYVDVSSQDPLITEQLERYNISYNFLGLRKVPTNVIIGQRCDKIVLKGPKLERIDLDSRLKGQLTGYLNPSNALMINSAKDISFVEALIDNSISKNIPLYFIVTPSLEPEFIYSRILPNGVLIIGYDDLHILHKTGPLHDDEAKIEMAFETIQKIRGDKITANRLYITMGKHGVLGSEDNEPVVHVKLDESFAEKVGYSASTKYASTNGAGDTFAAAVLYYEQVFGKFSPEKVAKKASEAAIRHIGYNGTLNQNAFRTERIPLSKKEANLYVLSH